MLEQPNQIVVKGYATSLTRGGAIIELIDDPQRCRLIDVSETVILHVRLPGTVTRCIQCKGRVLRVLRAADRNTRVSVGLSRMAFEGCGDGEKRSGSWSSLMRLVPDGGRQ
jgi:uncharacterized protein with PIN domain